MVQHYPITFANVNISRSKSDLSPTPDQFNQTILKLLIMKLYGIGGVGTGKLGNQVFAVKAGQQIVRQYQPVVSNPNTAAQVETRSKMKLISQVAAIVSPAIAIPSDGLRTKRNMFIKANYGLLSYSNNKASMSLPDMKLTKGTLALPAVTIQIDSTMVNVELSEEPQLGIEKVCYVLLRQNSDGKITFENEMVVEADNLNRKFAQSFGNYGAVGDVFSVLAYGIRTNTEKARLALGEMNAPTTAAIAELISTRKLSDSDVTMTETNGAFGTYSQA